MLLDVLFDESLLLLGTDSGRMLMTERGESVVSTVEGLEWIDSSDMRLDSGGGGGGGGGGGASVARGGAEGVGKTNPLLIVSLSLASILLDLVTS